MRHFFAYRFTFVIAAILVLACVLFAWIRSEDIVIISRKLVRAEAVNMIGAEFFANKCSTCHSTLPHLGGIAAVNGGREYLADFFLYGLNGNIPIQGDNRNVTHLPFTAFTDVEIAAVLNYMLSSWGNEKSLPVRWMPYQPQDISKTRARPLTPEEVHARRVALGIER